MMYDDVKIATQTWQTDEGTIKRITATPNNDTLSGSDHARYALRDRVEYWGKRGFELKYDRHTPCVSNGAGGWHSKNSY